MKARIAALLLLGIGFGLIVCLRHGTVVAENEDDLQEPVAPAVNPVGTYQLVAAGEKLFKLNTRTGEVWTLSEGRWASLGGRGAQETAPRPPAPVYYDGLYPKPKFPQQFRQPRERR